MGQKSSFSSNAVRKTLLPCVTWPYGIFWSYLPTAVGMTTEGNKYKSTINMYIFHILKQF